jgi:5-oxopent-3-ene-1,2,5-tricarboxylate decarboxylase/2-hydroxyhepta-2,4-diene-1,7-dioate isomerase
MAMIAGTIYGAALNDRAQREKFAALFEGPPYGKPPQRPVLYIKPHNCLAGDGIPVPPDLAQLEIAATLGLLIGRDAGHVTAEAALAHVAGVCLALDVAEPDDSYYRPPVRQRCRDGFLPLGAMAEFDPRLLEGDIETWINDAMVHAWSMRRLLRGAASLIVDISAFMTLAAGDLLLIGIPHDAPRARAGDRVTVRMKPLPELSVELKAETST